MKKIYLIFAALVFTSSCANLSPKTEELKQANKCMVWKDGLIGKEVVEVEGEIAKQKQTCWILNMFACTYTDYTFKNNSNEIRSSLPPADKTIAKLEGDKLSVSMTGATVAPFQLKAGRGDYELEGPVGPKQSKSFEFNESCTKRQAALGLLTMIAK